MIVMKFGGTSVADAERVRRVTEIVRSRRPRRPVVVVSALAGVTDLLERALHAARHGTIERLEPLVADLERRHRWALAGTLEDAGRRHALGLEVDRLFDELRQRLRSVRVLGEDTPRVRDALLAYGEGLSSRIVAAAVAERGLPARWVDAREVVRTDERFGQASPDLAGVRQRCRERLGPLLDADEIPVLGGFVGSSPSGATTTLGRGGSDTTATVLGLALGAEEIEIWTDVDGLMSADPRWVPAARRLERVSFAEAAELALYGARVLHPDAIAPAVERQIPVRVLNSARPDLPGTLVLGEPAPDRASVPVAIASRTGLGIARIASRRLPMDSGLPGRALAACSGAGIEPRLVLSTATAVRLVADGLGQGTDAWRGLAGEADVQLQGECAIVCVVGAAVVRDAALRGRVLAELARWDAELVVAVADGASVVAVVREAALGDGVRRLHERFFERPEEAWTTP